jgi:hypothetical protein
MRVIADDPRGIFSDEVLGGACARSRRAAERFAEFPISLAALEFAAARHAGQYRTGRSTTRRSSRIRSRWLGCCAAMTGQTK